MNKNKKQIICFLLTVFLASMILYSNKMNAFSATTYEFNRNTEAVRLLLQLIFPCLLGSVLALLSASWIKTENLPSFLDKKLRYFLIAILIIGIVVLSVLIISMYVSFDLQTICYRYMYYVPSYKMIHIILYFVLTLCIIKNDKKESYE